MQRAIRFMCVLFALVTLTSRRAEAHATLTSSVVLDVQPDGIEAEIALPCDQLGLALRQDLGDPSSLLPRSDAALRLYIGEHLRLSGSAAQAYSTVVRDLSTTKIEGADYVVGHVDFVPPSDAPSTSLTLHDDLILHRVVTHHILVSLRRDFAQGLLGKNPKMLGVLTYAEKEVRVPRESASPWRGAQALFAMGMEHIKEGTDHLLFLLVLLLPAPLVASNRRWRGAREARSVKDTIRALLTVVTAFTIGHSIALALATLRIVVIPSRPVEIAIGVSIVVTAIHALRPLFARREALVAAAFGLVHGLAFATALEELGLRGSALAVSLVSFNVGIETMQLAVVLVVVPWFVILSRTAIYSAFRIAGAAIAGALALGFIGERVSGAPNPITRVMPFLERHTPIAIGLLAVVAVIAWLVTKTSQWAKSPVRIRATALLSER